MTNPEDPIWASPWDSELKRLGFTKREYFAGLALQGIMFWDVTVNEPKDTGKVKSLAHQAVYMADALIAELSKSK